MRLSSEPNDEQLIRRLLNGQEEAFTVIYRRCSGPVYRFALHMTGSCDTAEEIVQDTFLHLLSNARAYEPSRGSVLAWLLGIARNLNRRTIGAFGDIEPLDETIDYETPAESDFLGEFTRRELIEAVRQAVLSLPPALREVVILCELQELEYREAAVALNCPIGTIRSRLHRARGMLVSKLQARCLA